jgi:hypothetical protein
MVRRFLGQVRAGLDVRGLGFGALLARQGHGGRRREIRVSSCTTYSPDRRMTNELYTWEARTDDPGMKCARLWFVQG